MPGTFCSEENLEITTENECKEAAQTLGLKWVAAYNSHGAAGMDLHGPPGCFATSANKVMLNTDPHPNRKSLITQYSPLCRINGATPENNKNITRMGMQDL